MTTSLITWTISFRVLMKNAVLEKLTTAHRSFGSWDTGDKHRVIDTNNHPQEYFEFKRAEYIPGFHVSVISHDLLREGRLGITGTEAQTRSWKRPPTPSFFLPLSGHCRKTVIDYKPLREDPHSKTVFSTVSGRITPSPHYPYLARSQWSAQVRGCGMPPAGRY